LKGIANESRSFRNNRMSGDARVLGGMCDLRQEAGVDKMTGNACGSAVRKEVGRVRSRK
jgi:hypothetical protein